MDTRKAFEPSELQLQRVALADLLNKPAQSSGNLEFTTRADHKSSMSFVILVFAAPVLLLAVPSVLFLLFLLLLATIILTIAIAGGGLIRLSLVLPDALDADGRAAFPAGRESRLSDLPLRFGPGRVVVALAAVAVSLAGSDFISIRQKGWY